MLSFVFYVCFLSTLQMTKLVYVFVDNTNLFKRGQATVAKFEKCGDVTPDRKYKVVSELQLDYGQLLEVLLDGRKPGAAPFLSGSEPPSTDLTQGFAMDQRNAGIHAIL